MTFRLRQATARSRKPASAAGAIIAVISFGFTLLPSPGLAAPRSAEGNKAVARTAFELLNKRDFKRFEAIHTKAFVKHYNNRPPENL